MRLRAAIAVVCLAAWQSWGGVAAWQYHVPLLAGGGVTAPSFTFTIVSQATPDAPYIVAATLPDSAVTWTDPHGNVTNSKTPAASFFTTNAGTYTLSVTNWTKVTGYLFKQSGTRVFLSEVHHSGITDQMTGLTQISFERNTGPISFDVGTLPVTINTLSGAFKGITGQLSGFPSVSHLTNVNTDVECFSTDTSYTGALSDVSGHIKSTRVDYLCQNDDEVATCPITNNVGLSQCTTYNESFAGCTNMYGNIGGWTWRTIITDFDCYNSKLSYTNRPGCFAANVKTNGFTMRWDNCALSQGDCSQILQDLYTSSISSNASVRSINVGGTTINQSNAPPDTAGWQAVTNLRSHGWTVTINP